MKIPYIPQELIAFLKEVYPLRSPKLDDSERQIFVRVGQQEVIATLEKFAAENEKRALLGGSKYNVHVKT